MKFIKWLEQKQLKEMMGSVGAIVSCKDFNNPNFQIQGSGSNLGCKNNKKIKTLTMKFKDGKK